VTAAGSGRDDYGDRDGCRRCGSGQCRPIRRAAAVPVPAETGLQQFMLMLDVGCCHDAFGLFGQMVIEATLELHAGDAGHGVTSRTCVSDASARDACRFTDPGVMARISAISDSLRSA
jgi:hypothetical protein